MNNGKRNTVRTAAAVVVAGALSAGTMLAGSGHARSDKKDIVDTAISAGSFTTLVKAVQAAGLVGTLKGPGPFTVFAPTDEAFARLPSGTLEALLEDKDRLIAVLTYHVVPGKVMASDVVKLDEATTVEGGKVSIHKGANGVMVDTANVVKTDIETSNGVIHVIDKVILPKATKG